MKIEVSRQVVDLIKSQAPEPRQFLRRALQGLSQNRGDIRSLEPPLEGYCRLRVRGYRILFAYGPRSIQCVFAERRSIVYEVFERVLAAKLSGADE